MVDDTYIDALIDIAKQYEREYRGLGRGPFFWHFGNPGQSRSLCDQTKNVIGRMLLAENARSVGYRYREVQNPAALTYLYRATKREYTPSQALMAIRGYEYQACETADWDRSEAYSFCRRSFVASSTSRFRKKNQTGRSGLSVAALSDARKNRSRSSLRLTAAADAIRLRSTRTTRRDGASTPMPACRAFAVTRLARRPRVSAHAERRTHPVRPHPPG